MNANKQDAGGEVTNPDNVGGLLPCPFCGHDDSLYIEHVEGTIRHPAYYVRCDYCGAQNGSTDSGEHVKKWNERAAELCRAAPAGGDVEVVRLRQLLAASQEQVRILSDMVERGQAHHERMMKLMDIAPAGGDDLYRQACDSVEEWKARALEAEADIARIHAQINAENGPTFMGEPVVSAPAGSGEVEKLIDDLIDHAFNDGNEGVEFRSEQVNTARAALLRKLQQGADYVMVPRDSAKMVAHVCSEWIDLFRDAPGIEKYERYSYEPAVEELRDEYAAIAASQGQEGGHAEG